MSIFRAYTKAFSQFESKKTKRSGIAFTPNTISQAEICSLQTRRNMFHFNVFVAQALKFQAGRNVFSDTRYRVNKNNAKHLPCF